MTSLKIQPGFISAQFFAVLMVSIDSKHPIKPISEDRQIPNRLKNEPGWATGHFGKVDIIYGPNETTNET